MTNLERKTKAELMEIITQKENEIIDLKEDLRQLEKCEKYDHITDEIRGAYSKLLDRGFSEEAALDLTKTMLTSGNIPADRYPGPSYNRHYYR